MPAETFRHVLVTTVQDAAHYTSEVSSRNVGIVKPAFVMLSRTFLTANSMDCWTFACVRLKQVSPTFRVNLVSLTLWLEN